MHLLCLCSHHLSLLQMPVARLVLLAASLAAFQLGYGVAHYSLFIAEEDLLQYYSQNDLPSIGTHTYLHVFYGEYGYSSLHYNACSMHVARVYIVNCRIIMTSLVCVSVRRYGYNTLLLCCLFVHCIYRACILPACSTFAVCIAYYDCCVFVYCAVPTHTVQYVLYTCFYFMHLFCKFPTYFHLFWASLY